MCFDSTRSPCTRPQQRIIAASDPSFESISTLPVSSSSFIIASYPYLPVYNSDVVILRVVGIWLLEWGAEDDSRSVRREGGHC
jgi:hypothetical protein